MLLLTTLLISMITTIALMPYCKGFALDLQAVDLPGGRKVHKGLMPKCGGMAMAIGAMTPIILWAPMTPLSEAVLIGGIIVVFFGIIDDIKDLVYWQKLAAQFAAALVAILIGGIKIQALGGLLPDGMVLPDWVAIPLTLVTIVGVTNATNLVDGLDGLAGGLSLLIFIGIGYLGYCEKDPVIMLIAFAISGSIIGFLRYNSHPAELFMGDAGSQLLGYVAIVLSLGLTQHHPQLNGFLPLAVIGLPVIDTVTVMVRRLLQKKSPFLADKNHFHHQFMGMGMYHSEAVLSIYLLQTLLVCVAILLRHSSEWILLEVFSANAIAIIGLFAVAEKTQFRLNRERFLHSAKVALRRLREEGHVVRISFNIVKVSVPALLFGNGLVAIPKTRQYFVVSMALLLFLLWIWSFKRQLIERILEFGYYLITPIIIYRGDKWIQANMSPQFITLYNLSFAVFFAFVLLTLKLSRRKAGFKSSPLDFLVVFIILLISALPDTPIRSHHLGLVAAKTAILLYSYEVLIGEIRLKSYRWIITTVLFFGLPGLKQLL